LFRKEEAGTGGRAECKADIKDVVKAAGVAMTRKEIIRG